MRVDKFIQIINSVQLFLDQNPVIVLLAVLWVLYWKGLALWKSSRLSQKKWFIVLLITNTLGILDIIYLYFVAQNYTIVEEDVIEEPTQEKN